MTPLAIVTATTQLDQARPCIESWIRYAQTPPAIYLVLNGAALSPEAAFETARYAGVYNAHDYLGSVPAFRRGVDMALKADHPIIACLHDDYEILEHGWDAKVWLYFTRHPQMGLAGFGGAIGLGSEHIYKQPYDPMQLARRGFRSNLVDAEAHGIRSLLAEPVACLDGFSQIGRRAFWEGCTVEKGRIGETAERHRPWTVLENLGFIHHFYDGALGCVARRYGWETWYVPLRSQHHGGGTAVGDPGYQEWAKTQVEGGDHGFWEAAHTIGYEAFRDVLPLRV
jgi:hypothetical protein